MIWVWKNKTTWNLKTLQKWNITDPPQIIFHHPEKNGRNVPMTDLWGLVYSSTWMAGFFMAKSCIGKYKNNQSHHDPESWVFLFGTFRRPPEFLAVFRGPQIPPRVHLCIYQSHWFGIQGLLGGPNWGETGGNFGGRNLKNQKKVAQMLHVPGTCLKPLFWWVEPFKTRSFPIKTRVIWVPGMEYFPTLHHKFEPKLEHTWNIWVGYKMGPKSSYK